MVTPKVILCAEDDDNYAELLRCALRYAGCPHEMHHVSDGAEAMEYLKGEGKYSDRSRYPIPSVILADLKMPKVNGFELVDWVRRHSSHRHLPVVVLTSSDEIKDINAAYSLGANSFLVKPPHVDDLRELMRMIDNYWVRINVREP